MQCVIFFGSIRHNRSKDSPRCNPFQAFILPSDAWVSRITFPSETILDGGSLHLLRSELDLITCSSPPDN